MPIPILVTEHRIAIQRNISRRLSTAISVHAGTVIASQLLIRTNEMPVPVSTGGGGGMRGPSTIDKRLLPLPFLPFRRHWIPQILMVWDSEI
jgi:hypothetical protein